MYWEPAPVLFRVSKRTASAALWPAIAQAPRPDAQATLFRASGGGVTLYGSVGPVAAPQRELLTDVARRVEE